MVFDHNQPAHTRFRQIFKERTTPIVIWAGAGVSATAGLPTWAGLRTQLETALEAKVSTLDEPARKPVEAHLVLAKHEASPWRAFDHLRLGSQLSGYYVHSNNWLQELRASV